MLQRKWPTETPVKIWGRSNDQILWPFQTVTLVWLDQTFASPSSDSTSTPRKTASENSYKNYRVIKRSDQKLWPFGIVTLVGRDQTSASPSSDSASTPKKTASENSSKNLRAVQGQIKSYGTLEPLLWSRATRPPPHQVAIPHLLQTKGLRKPLENIEGNPMVRSKVIALSNRYSGLARQDLCLIE